MSDRLNDGLLLGYQAGQDDQEQVTQWLQCKAWLEVAKLMLEEIRESNPTSPLADKEHVNGLYSELCREMRGQLEAGIEPEAVTIKPR